MATETSSEQKTVGHTPLPWRAYRGFDGSVNLVNDKGSWIAWVGTENKEGQSNNARIAADAQFALVAANHHEMLVDALQRATDTMADLSGGLRLIGHEIMANALDLSVSYSLFVLAQAKERS